VVAESQGATIPRFSAEREKGQTYYEAEMIVEGPSQDVLIDSTGAVVEVEEELAIDSLRGEVRRGLQATAGSGKLGKVESIPRHDALLAYEAKVSANGKKSEPQVEPDGKPPDHRE
jgi:hypothetical protein